MSNTNNMNNNMNNMNNMNMNPQMMNMMMQMMSNMGGNMNTMNMGNMDQANMMNMMNMMQMMNNNNMANNMQMNNNIANNMQMNNNMGNNMPINNMGASQGGWNLFFTKKDSGQKILIQVKSDEYVSEAISRYKIKAVDDKESKFIFNGKQLATGLKISQSGLQNNSEILVLSTNDVIGA